MTNLTINLPVRKSYHKFNLERWKEICDDPRLVGLPGKFETNRYGNIVMMPPASGKHSSFQGEIVFQLRTLLGGKALPECPISTINGVRAADVGWYSSERFDTVKGQMVFERAPEICVEILSPDNSDREMEEKRQLYFQAGADECWICDLEGEMGFYLSSDPDRKLEHSETCPDFPSSVE